MSTDVTKDLLEALKGLLVRAADDEEYGPDHAVTVARAAIARAEAALAKTQPDADGWIPWAGGECPLADGVWHRVKFRNGDECLDDQASSWGWGEAAGGFQIVAYRVEKL